MSSNILEYKGYYTRVEYDAEASVLRGEIEGIMDLVDFESDTLADVEQEFHNAVDNYLDLCARVGKQPDREYKGFPGKVPAPAHLASLSETYYN